MGIYFLILVYVVFTSVGLSTFLLGSAWPVMQADLQLPLYGAGVISAVISGGMIISSFFGGKIINWFGTGKTFLFSMVTTTLAVLCYWKFPAFSLLCLAAFPLGLGLGALNMTSNHFLSLNYKPTHMNWMHGFWGIGATVGPLIMSYYIAHGNAWQRGYLFIAMIYLTLAVVLFFSLPFFRQIEKESPVLEKKGERSRMKHIRKMPKLKLTLLCFFCCSAVEQTIGLWGSSYLLNCKDINAASASACLSVFFAGVTAGRFLSGIATMRLTTGLLIRIGLGIEILGGIFLILPLPVIFSMIGLILIGFGSSPVFPCMTQDTALKFGKKDSGTIVGYQIAFGFMGSTFIPPIFGWIASKTSIAIFPPVILLLILVLAISNRRVNQIQST